MEAFQNWCVLYRAIIFLFLCPQYPCWSPNEQYVLASNAPRAPDDGQGFVLPVFDINWSERYKEIHANRKGYLYGPPLLGNTSYFPMGVLGDAMVQRDKRLWFRDVQYVTDNVNNKEWPQAVKALAMVSMLIRLA